MWRSLWAVTPSGSGALLGDGEDLPEAGDRLVDRLRREDVLADLERPVAVDLGDGDLRQAVAVEERQEVVAELPRVVGDRRLAELLTACLEPLGGELVECGCRRRVERSVEVGDPDPALDVGEHVTQLCLRLRASDALGLSAGHCLRRERGPLAVVRGRELARGAPPRPNRCGDRRHVPESAVRKSHVTAATVSLPGKGTLAHVRRCPA